MKEALHSITCRKCSQVNPIDAKFCKNCGQSLENICPNCNTLNDDDARFCKNCGTVLEWGSPAEETRLTILQQSAPAGLQEKMRASSSELEGERKPVTILFADIVGSTSIAEKLDPEIWKEVVEGAHKRVGEAIYRYEGTIAQLLGDGVLAFFGAPITHEDDPVRAVRAALDIQEAIQDYEHDLKDLLETFQMRIGINTGEVVIGNIGTDMHLEYLALGDAVNIAARLQSSADPGKVLLSGSCVHLIGDRFELKSLGEITVKGKEEPVETYEIVGIKAAEEIGRAVQAYQTPYVGREDELEALRSSLLKLCEGQGQIVSLVGEAGIGKTRLVEEAGETLCEAEEDLKAEIAPPSSIRWLEGRALSYGGSLSYWTISHLLLSDLGLSDGASQVKIKVALRQRMMELFSGEQSGEVMPYVANLLGIPLERNVKERIESLDGETLKKETHRALGDYFSQVARRNRTVFVFEDMHWGDPSSLEVLEGLLSLTDHVPLLILMLMRIDRDHGSWDLRIKAEKDFHHRFTDIHLRRLSEKDSRMLVTNLLGSYELPDEISDPILARAEGNPFYLEEVVRHMIEEGMIAEDEDGWHANETMGEIGIPDTLQGVLLARIDRLEEDVRHTLQMASVIGKSFLYRILETISEAEQELDAHLSQLQRLDLVREKTRIPELEYIFRQTLTQEAAYNSLLHKRRKEFHLKVGEALENLFPERIDDFLGLLAYHFEEAEAHDKAMDYLIKAGDKARLAYAHDEAIGFYDKAKALLIERDDAETLARTAMKLGLTYQNAFDTSRAHQAFQESFNYWDRVAEIRYPSLPSPPHALRMVLSTSALDPCQYLFDNEFLLIKQLFDGLILFKPDMSVAPGVAKSWEVLESGRIFLFHLREDVNWTDGSPVTAHDFEFGWKRLLDPETRFHHAYVLFDIKGAKDYHEGMLPNSDHIGIKVLDDTTLFVELENPCAYFLYLAEMFMPLPKHVVSKHGVSWTNEEHIVTNGPFKVARWRYGESLILDRNPDYYGDFPGNLDRIKFKNITGGVEEHLRIYHANMLDIVNIGGLSPIEFSRVMQGGIDDYMSESLIGYWYVGFNTKRPPFDDKNVRLALSMAIDKEKLAYVSLKNWGAPALGGVLTPGVPGYSGNIGISHNPDHARQLLHQSGYLAKDSSMEMMLDGLMYTGQLLKVFSEALSEQWFEKLGINISWKQVDSGSYFETLSGSSRPHLWIGGWAGDILDPAYFLQLGTTWKSRCGWENQAFDDLLDRAQYINNQAERLVLYRQADRILMDESPILPLVYGRQHYLVKPWVKNFRLCPRMDWFLQDVIIEPH
jgi:ABC-type oligopeptide transport system substrate-binding subunit/class 3 adenylate cyclase/ribosomal protein L40E